MVSPQTQCRQRRTFVRLIGIACFALFVGFAESRNALGGCGDYLLPPIEISRHQTLPDELVASGVAIPQHQERPCRGPNCRRRPIERTPVPAPVVISAGEHWADLKQDRLFETPSVARQVRPDCFFASLEHAFRLDRPPRG